MDKSTTTIFYVYLIFSYFALISCAPKTQDDNEVNGNDVIPKLINQSLDYNAMVGHFKDFFMFLPVMFTTLKESMTGFPKFAEGVKILTNPNNGDEDCKCQPKAPQRSNDIE